MIVGHGHTPAAAMFGAVTITEIATALIFGVIVNLLVVRGRKRKTD